MPQLPLPPLVARVVDAVKVRWFAAQLQRLRVVQRPLVRIGSDWGGWSIPDDVLDSSSICYCAGAGGDVSFDLGVMKRYGATIRCFDPFEIFGRQAMELADGDPRFSFHEIAITAQDGPLLMYGRQDEIEGAVSAANIYRTRDSFVRPGRSLSSLMKEFGDPRIDLLKLDIEGSEYEVLESLDPASLGVKVLCVEFHHTSSAARALSIIKRLGRDYELVRRVDRGELTFVHR